MSFMLFLVPGLLLLAALAYARHHAAVAVLAALLPAYLVRFSLFGLVPTTALEAAIVLTALAGAASRSTRAQWGYAWRRLPAGVIVLVLLFLIAAVLGVVVSPHGRTSLGVLKGWILSPLLLGWLIFAAGEHAKTRRAIQSSLLFSAATMALIGLGQIQALPRVQGLYDAPNSLALFLVPLTILAWWQKKIFIALLLAVAVLATQSAAGIGALAAAALVGGIFWPSKAGSKRWSAIALLLLLAAAYFTSTGRLVYLTRSLREGVPNSTTVRRQLWSISLELIREHPLAGVGLGAFEPAYQQKLHQRFANYKLQTTNYDHHYRSSSFATHTTGRSRSG
jgi:O-antigen ligase